MASTKQISRQEKGVTEAVADIKNGSKTVRAAAAAAHVPATTLFRCTKAASSAKAAGASSYVPFPAGRRPDITAEEESWVVELIREQSVPGHPMRRSDVADAVAIIVQTMPRGRRAKFRFKNGIPGMKFLAVSLSVIRPKSS
jgi:hypothetical protein